MILIHWFCHPCSRSDKSFKVYLYSWASYELQKWYRYWVRYRSRLHLSPSFDETEKWGNEYVYNHLTLLEVREFTYHNGGFSGGVLWTRLLHLGNFYKIGMLKWTGEVPDRENQSTVLRSPSLWVDLIEPFVEGLLRSAWPALGWQGRSWILDDRSVIEHIDNGRRRTSLAGSRI